MRARTLNECDLYAPCLGSFCTAKPLWNRPLTYRELKGSGARSLTLLQTSHSFMTRWHLFYFPDATPVVISALSRRELNQYNPFSACGKPDILHRICGITLVPGKLPALSWCTTVGREGARSGGEADNSTGVPDRQGRRVHRRECHEMSIRKQTVVDWEDGLLCVLRPALPIRYWHPCQTALCGKGSINPAYHLAL